MYKDTRSYSLIRTLILASASLAIVGVLFAVYQSMTGPPPSRSPEAARREAAPAHATPGSPETPKGVAISDDVAVGPGDRIKIRLYSPQGDQVRMELSVRAWEPAAERGDQFNLTEPEIRLRTPDGQLVQVTADSGLVQLKKSEGDSYEPQRGRLTGNVQIKVDRLDEKQRAALPPEERDRPGPDRLITVKLNEVDFDLEYAHLETMGPFQLESAEADIQGQGLALRYNEVDSSIEELRIARRGRIAVRGLGATFRVAMPGAKQGPAQSPPSEPLDQEPPAATPDPAYGGPQPELPDDGIPVLPIEASKPAKGHATVTYRAQFTGDVQVRQLEEGEITGELLADALELLFDFGQQQREAARAQAAAPTATGTEPPDETGQPDARAGTELTVTWSGPLVLTTAEPSAEQDPAELPRQRVQITATGREVRLRQAGRGSARCKKLVFHQETEQAWLYGEPDAPVVLDTSDGGHLEGPEVVFDTPAGTARIAGPGRMWDTRSRPAFATGTADAEATARRVDIRFDDEVNISFAQTVREMIDPDTGAKLEKRQQYLETAVFRGNVLMQQGEDSMAGGRIQIDFDPPRKEGSVADNLRRLRGEGNVAFIHGTEAVRCRQIDVEMGLDESGRIGPRLARAYGGVSATQQGRTITASDRMIAHLRSFRQEREPFDLNKARAIAMARGRDPDSVDWDKVRADYESKDRFQPGLLRLEAYEDVAVRDPEQNLRVDAAALDCTFRGGRDIDQALVTGSASAPAFVELDDFSISGREVELDVSGESAQVPGAGRLTFRSTRDLDGRELDEPIPVAITWSQRMTFRGAQNRAILTGGVHAATEESILDCGELIVDFADPEDRGAGEAQERENDWWIFTPLAKRLQGGGDDRDDSSLGRRFDKEPTYILAAGGAVALTSKTEPATGRTLSRGRIAGPKILVDLRSEVMTIEDAGNLLIEDYELPSAVKDRPTGQRTPFGGLGVGSPSQTFITWTGQMAYYFGNQAAVFEQGVEMRHRSGTKIVLGREVFAESAGTLDESLPDAGRDAFMTCGQLVVKFNEAEEPTLKGKRRGAGRMSGYELTQFEATRGVHFQDAGIVVLAHKIAFDAARDELAIRGSEPDPVEIYDQRGKFRRMRGPVFYWNRATGQIDAPKATMIGR